MPPLCDMTAIFPGGSFSKETEKLATRRFTGSANPPVFGPSRRILVSRQISTSSS